MQNSDLSKDNGVGLMQVGLLVFTLGVLAALSADTVWQLPAEVSRMIRWLDGLACVVFFTDFCLRFYRAERKWAFLRWGWVDLVASIPYFSALRYGRLVRVLRVIRLLRGVRIVYRVLHMVLRQKIQTGAAALLLTAFLLVAFSSISILVCEQHGEGNIKTAEDAIWWSISTITTVGYGDKVPVTTEGRILGMGLMIAGVGMFGGLSGLVAAIFLGGSEGRSADTREILERLEAIQAALESRRREDTQPSPGLEAAKSLQTTAPDVIERRRPGP